MSARTVVAMIALLVAVAGAAAAAPVGALDGVASIGQSGNASNASNASLGATISAFMQASAADAQGSVDNGMFAAEFNSTEDPEARAGLVTGRAKALEMRVERLRAERAELLDDSDGNVTVAERAKAARLASRIESLERAINQTEHAAQVAGVNTTRLDELRSNASQLAGPEVAALATGLVGNGNAPPGAGPPAHANSAGKGPGGRATATEGLLQVGNGSEGDLPGNASAGDRGNGSAGNGPPDDRGNGPPEDRGNGSNTAGDGTSTDDSSGDQNTATETESTETGTE